MKLKKFLTDSFKNIKEIDLKLIIEGIKNFNIKDLKNINYRRILYNLRKSKYTKPSLGISSAIILLLLILIPEVKTLNNSFRKLKQYRYEAKNLDLKIIEFEDQTKNFNNINLIMEKVDSSFLKKKDEIFVINLINKAAKKVNVKIDEFKPILNSDTKNLCKSSKSQKKSQKFKKFKMQRNKKSRGTIEPKYYEVNFSSDYLDIVKYFQEIQNYDVNLSIHCLEVISENQKLVLSNDDLKGKTSIITQLDQFGSPVNPYNNSINGVGNSNFSKVISRIIFKIPFQVN
tara:strand:- start:1652 stop:2512 length:861 start_codon:yes stop_codon:yes gene_type:complete